jgi:transcriptional regulator with XRE-family HTH domain
LSSPLRNEHAFLGKAVRSLREYAELTQEEVARRSESDLHPTWVSHLEKGRVNPTHQTVENIAKGIGVFPSRIQSLAEAYAEISKTKKRDSAASRGRG